MHESALSEIQAELVELCVISSGGKGGETSPMGLSPEFELVDDIVVKMAAKEEKHGSASLSNEQQIVGTIWQVSGIVSNGGIQYLLEHIAIDIVIGRASCRERV